MLLTHNTMEGLMDKDIRTLLSAKGYSAYLLAKWNRDWEWIARNQELLFRVIDEMDNDDTIDERG